MYRAWLLSGTALAGVLLIGGIGGSRVEAVTIREDQAPLPGGIQEYWDSTNQFRNVANIGVESASGVDNRCTGTLINSRTLLTAAHCMSIDTPPTFSYDFTTLGNFSITFAADSVDGDPLEVSGVIAHEGYDGDATNDIALIALDAPVLTIDPVTLTTSAPQVGDVVHVVGYGLSGAAGRDIVVDNGNGLEFQNADNRRRVSYNYIDFVGEIPGQGNLIVFDFDDPSAPEDFDVGMGVPVSSTPVHPLEGASAGGDSGGPMFLRLQDGRIVQVGVSQGGEDVNDTGDGNYTSLTTYTNVAAYLDWIATHSFLRNVANASGGDWQDSAIWQGGEVPDNVESPTPGETRYYQVSLSGVSAVNLTDSREVDWLTLSGGHLNVSQSGSLDVIDHLSVGAGSLAQLDGTVTGDTQVLAGGILGGTGTISGTLTNGGVLSPGNSIGTFAVDGNLGLGSAGQLLIEVDGAQADQISVSGTAALDGGVTFAPDLRLADQSNFVFLTAGAVTGSFSSATSDSLFFEPTLSTNGNSVSVTFAKTRALGDIVASDNRQDVAAVLESLPTDAPDGVSNAIGALGTASTTEEVRALVRQISGEAHGINPALGQRSIEGINRLVAGRLARIGRGSGTTTLALLTSDQTNRQFALRTSGGEAGGRMGRQGGLGRLLTLVEASVPEAGHLDGALAVGSPRGDLRDAAPGFWMEHFRTAGDVAESTSASGVGYQITGTSVGYDVQLTEKWIAGAAASYTKTDTDVITGLGDGAETHGRHGSLYGRYQTGAFSALASVAVSRNSTEAIRYTSVGAATQSAVADYSGWGVTSNVTFLHDSDVSGIAVQPALSLEYAYQVTDGFQEQGSAALLTVDGYSRSALNLSAVMRFSKELSLGESISFEPELRFGGVYDLLNEDPSVTARFTGTAPSFRSQGVETDRGGALVGAGVLLNVAENLSFYADYEGYFAGNETSHTTLVGTRLHF